MARLLYLDDDGALVALVARHLERAGHSVAGFTNAPEALAVFRALPSQFDLVITDMSMLGASGLDFAKEVLAIAPSAVVVIATGCEEPNWAAHARASGVRAVIEKPTDAGEMAARLAALLPGTGSS